MLHKRMGIRALFGQEGISLAVSIVGMVQTYDACDALKHSPHLSGYVVLNLGTMLVCASLTEKGKHGMIIGAEFLKFCSGLVVMSILNEKTHLIAKATAEGAFSLIGGGDSVACCTKFGLTDKVSYISTGGGALLEAIEGKVLPGVAAIKGE